LIRPADSCLSWQQIDACLDCFIIVEQQLKKISELNGEIDTLNQENNLIKEQVEIKVDQNKELKKQARKDKALKIWVPIVSGVAGAAAGYGIGKAVK
jgi:TolA-binding protein